MLKFANIFKWLVVFGCICLPIFGFIDTLPLKIWDEARLAMNALAMYDNNQYLITYYNDQPDLWNTKPPFMIWCQVFCLKIFGINILAIRLPSADATFLTCLLIIFFSKYHLKKIWFGVMAVMVLVTTQGYLTEHVARSGDYDAMLIFFLVISSLLYYLFLQFYQKKYIYLFFIFLALAVLTKSISGLFFIPGLLLYTLWNKQFVQVIKNLHVYFGLGLFLVLVISYYGLRELYHPGYLESVRLNELSGRYFNTIENHSQSFWYYFQLLIQSHLFYWIYFVPFGLYVGLFHTDLRFRNLNVFCITLILSLLVILSLSQTKLEWYDAPVFPFFAIIIANVLFWVFNYLTMILPIKKLNFFAIVPSLVIILLYIAPYNKIMKQTFNPKINTWEHAEYDICLFLQEVNDKSYNHFTLIHEGPNANIQFYLYMLKAKGIQIKLSESTPLYKDQFIIVHQKKVFEQIQNDYIIEHLNTHPNFHCVKIIDKK